MGTKTSEKKKVNKPELIDDAEPIKQVSLFELKKIEMKDDYEWRLKLVLKTRLNHTFREYKVKLSVNERPFEMRIEDLEKKKRQIQDDAQLAIDDGMPSSARNKHLKNIDNEIDEVRAELAQMLRDLPELEFEGVIEELKYKHGDTVISMFFPSAVLADLNQQRYLLKHYKIELIRE